MAWQESRLRPVLAMAAEAYRRGCGRMEWTVLGWNQHAIDFYNKLGATYLREWHPYRLDKDELARLVEQSQVI